ncbi:hypothetical protein LBR04_22380 [Levilactobacillus brevis]|nr:hypothetical protein LBR04_22380 [Levilactobacillus brevis]
MIPMNMTNTIVDEVNNDFLKFCHSSTERRLITSFSEDDQIRQLFEQLYKLSFCLYNLFESDVTNSPNHAELNMYINFLRRDLISTLDLLNLQHIDSSKKECRSIIESIIRISLFTEREAIYKNNIHNHIYHSTSELKELKSAVTTHKIGRLTTCAQNYFSDSIISDCVSQLNQDYSSFSKLTHTNEKLGSKTITTLNAVSNISPAVLQSSIMDIIRIIENSILCIYYVNVRLVNGQFLNRTHSKYIEITSDEQYVANHLSQISEFAYNLSLQPN